MIEPYPESLLRERDEIARSGSFRERVRYDVIARPHHAFGLLAAADIARFCGATCVTAIEFGVAEGDGLLNLCEVADRVTAETGVGFKIYGFDTGTGLPKLKDYRDHPEIWSAGDFALSDKNALEAKLPRNAEIIWGDIEETLKPFMLRLEPASPIGFVSLDVDIYHSTKASLALYEAPSEKLLPVSIAYFDDTLGSPARIGSLFRNRWAGQLLAIDEFNERHATRKIDEIRVLRYRRPLFHEQWLAQTYAVHVLDHPMRNRTNARQGLGLDQHLESTVFDWKL